MNLFGLKIPDALFHEEADGARSSGVLGLCSTADVDTPGVAENEANILGLKIPDALFHGGARRMFGALGLCGVVPVPGLLSCGFICPQEPRQLARHQTSSQGSSTALYRWCVGCSESKEKEPNVVGLKIPDFLFHETPTEQSDKEPSRESYYDSRPITSVVL
jgi:hypothetical protein